MLAKNKTLKSLSIQQNSIGSNAKNIKLLVEGLKANKSIETLNMSKNLLTAELSLVFQSYLSDTSRLRELVYENNMIATDDESVKRFMSGLESNKSLITLGLGGNYLGDSFNYFNYLGKALNSCTTIVNLSLSNNLIDVKTCSLEVFSAGLAKCRNIQHLNFSNCKLGAKVENARFLGEALKSLKGLLKLNLRLNDLGICYSNVENIMNKLTHCKKLSILNLDSNSLGASEQGTAAFQRSFEQGHLKVN